MRIYEISNNGPVIDLDQLQCVEYVSYSHLEGVIIIRCLMRQQSVLIDLKVPFSGSDEGFDSAPEKVLEIKNNLSEAWKNA